MCGIIPSPAGAKNIKVVKHVTWVLEISADKIHDRLFRPLGVACYMDVLFFLYVCQLTNHLTMYLHIHTHLETDTNTLIYAHFQAKSVVFNFLGTSVQPHRTYGKITIFVIWRFIK